MIEGYHQAADCLKFIHRYYLNTLDGPLQLVVLLVFYEICTEGCEFLRIIVIALFEITLSSFLSRTRNRKLIFVSDWLFNKIEFRIK